MNTKPVHLRGRHSIALMLLGLLWIPSARTQTRIVLSVDAAKDTISRHIYGHFSEHLGRCIYGGYFIGEGSTTIPNVRGIRKDVVEALKKIKIPNLRWPGGCFADTYHWKDGIGPKANRPTMVNSWWGGVTEDNSFGTYEFLDLCEQLGAEPYFSGNVGSGTVQELVQWVQYTNFEGRSPMSDLRSANGHSAPWSVKYWGIGNEAWGCGGNMTAEHYADVYRVFATYLPGGSGPKPIFRVASGSYGDNYQWTETLMKNIPLNLIEGLALHHYSVVDWKHKGSATKFSEEEYGVTMQRALAMEEYVHRHSTVMDRYDPSRKVALVVDEWGGWYDVEPGTNPAFLYQQNTMRDAMIAGVTLNIFNNHCERVRMANLAQTVNVLQAVVLTDSTRVILTPTYHVMEMYAVHHDAVLVPLTFNSPRYVPGKESLPALSASASRDKSGKVHISLVNIDPGRDQQVDIELRGSPCTKIRARILQGSNVQDHNTFEAPDRVKPEAFAEMKLMGGKISGRVPKCSVLVLELE